MAIIEEILTDDDRVGKTDNLKQEGNTLFGKGEYSAAIEKYNEALEACPEELMEKKGLIYSNIAASYIKISDWEEAVKSATEAIEMGVPNEKALERRAYAYQQQDKPDDALKDYKEILSKHPNRKDIESKIPALEKRSAEKMEELKNDLLNKLKGLGNACLRPFGLSTDSFEMIPNGEGGYSIGMKKPAPSEE